METIDRKNEVPEIPMSKLLLVFIILAVLICIVLGTGNNLFSYIAFALSLITITFFKTEDSLCLLVFVVPFAKIFKINPDAQSFFTYLILFFVCYNVFKTIKSKKMSEKFLVAFCAFATFLMMQIFLSFHLMRGIKILSYLLLIYFAINSARTEKTDRNIFLSYITGIITASAISAFKIIPNLSDFIVTKRVADIKEYVVRFSGMDGDPNYYAINVIIALCLIVVLNHKKMLGTTASLVLATPLVIFAVMTYSKSAFLMLFLPLFMLLYSKIKNRKHLAFVMLFIGILVLIFSIIAGKIEFLDIVLSRFTAADDAAELTTGRSDIWIEYFDYFASNAFALIFGGGLNAKLVSGAAAHNTYVDLILYFGIIGTMMFVALLRALMRSVEFRYKRNLINHSVWICVIIMYFFLSELFYFDCPIHIIMAMFVSTTNCSGDSEIKKYNLSSGKNNL